MSSLRQTPISCPGHTRPVVQVAFSKINESGQYYMISACKDGKPMLRQGDTGDWIGTFEGHKGAVWAATLNPQATRAATGAADFSAKLWDAKTGIELASFSHKHIVKSVAFDGNGERLLTGSNEKKLRVWSLGEDASSEAIVTMEGHKGNLKRAEWLDDNMVVSISDDKTLKSWDVRNGSEVQSVDLPSAAADMEIQPDGVAALLCCGRSVYLWDLRTMSALHEFPMDCPIYSASRHPNGETFVCGGEDIVIYKCSVDNGEKLESHKGHFGPIHSVRYSPDGRLYASGSEDGTLRLWQHTVGEQYGLWRLVTSSSATDDTAVAPPVVAEP